MIRPSTPTHAIRMLLRRRRQLDEFEGRLVDAFCEAVAADTVCLNGVLPDSPDTDAWFYLSVAADLVLQGPLWLSACRHCHRIIVHARMAPQESPAWRHTDRPDYPAQCDLPHAPAGLQAAPIPETTPTDLAP